MTPRPIHSRPRPRPTNRRRGTTPSAASSATRSRRQRTTSLPSTAIGEKRKSRRRGTELSWNHVDTVWPYWNLMDFTPEGRPKHNLPRFLEKTLSEQGVGRGLACPVTEPSRFRRVPDSGDPQFRAIHGRPTY